MKNVLITGGAGGIGSEIAKKFVENGYFVYIFDVDENAGKIVKTKLGNNCEVINLDVTSTKDLSAFANSHKDLAFNYVITCAGRALKNEWKPFEKQSVKTISKSIELNLVGHLNVIHATLPMLKNAVGDKAVLTISSVNAVKDFGLPSYSVSKAGLASFSVVMANEFGKAGIRINSLLPGTVVTEATKTEPKNFDSLLKTTSLGFFVNVKDVANMAFDMCEKYVSLTGQNIVLDAGQSR